MVVECSNEVTQLVPRFRRADGTFLTPEVDENFVYTVDLIDLFEAAVNVALMGAIGGPAGDDFGSILQALATGQILAYQNPGQGFVNQQPLEWLAGAFGAPPGVTFTGVPAAGGPVTLQYDPVANAFSWA